VSLDYSGIELRVLALLSGDKQLLEDMVEGDVHAEVAAVIAGHAINKKTKAGKALRQEAKGVSFGIIYGSGPVGLAANMRCQVSKAQGYIDFWQARYPKAFNLRYDMMAEAQRTGFIRMIDGGTIYMSKSPELPRASNYPVQRAACSILARAMVRHKASLDVERAKGKQRMTRMLSTIHDALIDEAAVKDTKKCLQIMTADMIAGYSDMFPDAPTDNLVEGGIGPNWAELE
jgi:DNA polymerase-1